MSGAEGLARRPEADADEAFLRALYATTREYEMARVPWDDAQKAAFLNQQFEAQRLSYRREFPDADYDVLLRDGRPAGRLYLDRSGEMWLLLDVALLPPHRNAGLGTALLRELLADAGAAGRAVRLHVETFNPARRLYDRLGFVPVADNGLHVRMIWQPPDS